MGGFRLCVRIAGLVGMFLGEGSQTPAWEAVEGVGFRLQGLRQLRVWWCGVEGSGSVGLRVLAWGVGFRVWAEAVEGVGCLVQAAEGVGFSVQIVEGVVLRVQGFVF